MAVEAGLSVYVVGGQGVRLFVVVVSCGVLDVFLLDTIYDAITFPVEGRR